MAYQQPHHDPYYDNNNYNTGTQAHPSHNPSYHTQAPYEEYPPTGNTGAYTEQYPLQHTNTNAGYDNYGQQNWDTKSYNSTHAGSQAHLVPQVNYNASAPAYPPAQYGGIPPPMQNYQAGGYQSARDKMMKRRSVRKVELQQGNLVLDMHVPTHIVPKQFADSEEHTKMRYTAATCDPDDFASSKYSLRPFMYGRKTEIFVVMTMYNEDEVLFCKTMNAVIKNIAHLCGRGRSSTWGAEGWKKIVVCIVSDGRNKINKRTLQVLELMGCYQEGIAKDSVGAKDVTAHIFEYTSSVIVTDTGEVSMGSCPIQILFCLKEQNKKKLNSHRWFFNAFGPLIRPNVCILLDVGTKPTGTSIYELWKCFDKHSNVGGACGEICVDTGRGCSLLLTSPLAASQNFEYKMSNILDKPLESVFGYISVLPGAFSAYRYRALQNGPDGKGPLASYFKGETMHGGGVSGAGLFERNMYLAEDRILCFEIVTKKNEGWVLKYVKSAKASTDVPTSLPEFISQRRRWLNGSLFASVHATTYWFRIWTSGQGFFRKLVLQIEFIYNGIQLIFTWTALANFYLAFFFLTKSASTPSEHNAFNFISNTAGQEVFAIFLKLYIALLFVIVVCSLGNRPQGSKWIYWVCVFLFGLCNIITLWCAGFTVYLAAPKTEDGWKDFPSLIEHNVTFRNIVISLAATYGLYFFSSFMHLEPWHMFTSFLQYLFFLPSYVNILMMYAMCNLHDVSWGTKGDNGSAKDLGGAKKVKGADGQEMLEVEVPTAREDVDQLWQAARSALKIVPPPEKEHRDASTKQADDDRNSRTNVVLAWLGTNITMILLFTSDQFDQWIQKVIPVQDTSAITGESGTVNVAFNPYLTVLFVALAGLSAIRFLGSALYLLFRLVGL